MSIFRAYDIRGVYPKDLNETLAKKIGSAFARLNPGKIVVGGDVRLSSPALKKALIEGLTEAGCDVIDIGVVTSPLVLFATRALKADGGVMATASHNPPEYNGLRFNDKNAVPISHEAGLNKIERIVKGTDEKGVKKAKKAGRLSQKQTLSDYAKFIFDNFRGFRGKIPFKIVVDGGNGAAGAIYAGILEKAGAKVVRLYCEPNGNFPNHMPDPERPENLKDLQAAVKKEKADLGVAYDCDGDRAGFVDEHGDIVPESKTFILLIKGAAKGKVVYDVECSQTIDETIKAAGGVPVICRTGNTYISRKMLETKAVLGGEKSGHYYFKETGAADDALFATLRLLEYLIKTKQRLSAATRELPEYIRSYRRLPVPDDKKFAMVAQIKDDVVRQGLEPITLDGVRVNFSKGWVLVRASQTEPKLSVTCEASDKKEFERVERFANGLLAKAGVVNVSS